MAGRCLGVMAAMVLAVGATTNLHNCADREKDCVSTDMVWCDRVNNCSNVEVNSTRKDLEASCVTGIARACEVHLNSTNGPPLVEAGSAFTLTPLQFIHATLIGLESQQLVVNIKASSEVCKLAFDSEKDLLDFNCTWADNKFADNCYSGEVTRLKSQRLIVKERKPTNSTDSTAELHVLLFNPSANDITVSILQYIAEADVTSSSDTKNKTDVDNDTTDDDSNSATTTMLAFVAVLIVLILCVLLRWKKVRSCCVTKSGGRSRIIRDGQGGMVRLDDADGL